MTRTTSRWTAFGAFAALCCVLGCENQGKHEVETQLLVIRKAPPSNLGIGNEQQFQEDYLATQIILIKSPTIINRALKHASVKNLKLAEGGADAAMAIRDALTVRRDPDSRSSILYVGLQCDDEKEGIAMLNAITQTYLAFLEETYKNVSDKTLELILQARQTLKESLDRSEQEYLEFRTKNPFLLFKGESEPNLYIARLRVLNAKRTEIDAKKVDIVGRLARASAAIRDNKKTVSILLKANEWAARSGFDKLPMEARQGKDALTAYADSLQEELDELSETRKTLDEIAEIAEKQVRDISNYEAIDERLRRTIQSNQSLFDSIVKRVNEIGLTKDFGGYDAQVLWPPRAKKVK